MIDGELVGEKDPQPMEFLALTLTMTDSWKPSENGVALRVVMGTKQYRDWMTAGAVPSQSVESAE